MISTTFVITRKLDNTHMHVPYVCVVGSVFMYVCHIHTGTQIPALVSLTLMLLWRNHDSVSVKCVIFFFPASCASCVSPAPRPYDLLLCGSPGGSPEGFWSYPAFAKAGWTSCLPLLSWSTDCHVTPSPRVPCPSMAVTERLQGVAISLPGSLRAENTGRASAEASGHK